MVLVNMGVDLSLPGVLRFILAEERFSRAFSFFCEVVMRRKEKAERERGRGKDGGTASPSTPPAEASGQEKRRK